MFSCDSMPSLGRFWKQFSKTYSNFFWLTLNFKALEKKRSQNYKMINNIWIFYLYNRTPSRLDFLKNSSLLFSPTNMYIFLIYCENWSNDIFLSYFRYGLGNYAHILESGDTYNSTKITQKRKKNASRKNLALENKAIYS